MLIIIIEKKTAKSNKARFFVTYSEENSLLGKSLISTYSISISLSLKWVGWGWALN